MPEDEIFHIEERGGEIVAIRIIIEGRVQKVGMRNWIRQIATRHKIDGWVRNRMNLSVEALLCGPEDTVKEIINICYQGPSFAHVKRVKEFPQADTEDVPKGFFQLPTV